MNICAGVNRGWAADDSYRYAVGSSAVGVGYAISPENASDAKLGNCRWADATGETKSSDLIDKGSRTLYYASAIGCVAIIIAGVILFRKRGKK